MENNKLTRSEKGSLMDIVEDLIEKDKVVIFTAEIKKTDEGTTSDCSAVVLNVSPKELMEVVLRFLLKEELNFSVGDIKRALDKIEGSQVSPNICQCDDCGLKLMCPGADLVKKS